MKNDIINFYIFFCYYLNKWQNKSENLFQKDPEIKQLDYLEKYFACISPAS